MVAAAIWFAVIQPLNHPGLVWGGSLYKSKQEFKLYLKSKGLNYSRWLARNPGVAPWEPGTRAVKSDRTTRTWDWKRDALLAANAALLATIAAALLARFAAEGRWRRDGSLAARDGPPRGTSAVPTIRRTLAQGLGYVEHGAEELTHAAVDRVRKRHDRLEVTLFAFGTVVAVATALLITRVLS